MPSGSTLLWLRLDLRLRDNVALRTAIERGGPIIPVFIWSPDEENPWPPGAASRWWLHHSLDALAGALRECGSRLMIRQGPSLDVLRDLIRSTRATGVVWTERGEAMVTMCDEKISAALASEGIEAVGVPGALLHDPEEVRTGGGDPYRVFTPFYRRFRSVYVPPPELEAPRAVPAPGRWPRSESLASLKLLPRIDRAGGIPETWTPGEVGADAVLQEFIATRLPEYAVLRDRPDRPGTSQLSPYLHFGEISPHRVWREVESAGATLHATEGASEPHLRQLVWREFAHHLLHHAPHTTQEPLREQFRRFPWGDDPRALRAWQRGRTGFPIVDAGMRELWHTGWMHNRVRMLVGSLLVKNLLIPWLDGARWFWDTLVDADLASNTMGWQWVAGSGADAAPYFRIFNPVLQGKKFDPDGDYVRRWVPELAGLPAEQIHAPWEADPIVLAGARVELGRTYPEPIVDLRSTRERALAAYATIKRG